VYHPICRIASLQCVDALGSNASHQDPHKFCDQVLGSPTKYCLSTKPCITPRVSRSLLQCCSTHLHGSTRFGRTRHPAHACMAAHALDAPETQHTPAWQHTLWTHQRPSTHLHGSTRFGRTRDPAHTCMAAHALDAPETAASLQPPPAAESHSKTARTATHKLWVLNHNT
jgi:hypothetical protein